MTVHRGTMPLAADEKDAERNKIVAAMQRFFVIEEPQVVQKLYTTANERLDAVIAEVAHADSGLAANVTPMVNRRHK